MAPPMRLASLSVTLLAAAWAAAAPEPSISCREQEETSLLQAARTGGAHPADTRPSTQLTQRSELETLAVEKEASSKSNTTRWGIPGFSSSSGQSGGPWGACTKSFAGWNNCIVKDQVCATSCGRTHMTLDSVCQGANGPFQISNDGECDAQFSCPVEISDAMTIGGVSGSLGELGASVLEHNGVTFWAAPTAGSCMGTSAMIKGMAGLKASPLGQ